MLIVLPNGDKIPLEQQLVRYFSYIEECQKKFLKNYPAYDIPEYEYEFEIPDLEAECTITKWNVEVVREFYRQADREKITPFSMKDTTEVAKWAVPIFRKLKGHECVYVFALATGAEDFEKQYFLYDGNYDDDVYFLLLNFVDNFQTMSAGAKISALIKLMKDFAKTHPGAHILLYINSEGGEFNAGVRLSEFVRARNIDTLVNDACKAESMASMVWYNGRRRYVSKTAQIMVHRIVYVPNADDISRGMTVDRLEKQYNFISTRDEKAALGYRLFHQVYRNVSADSNKEDRKNGEAQIKFEDSERIGQKNFETAKEFSIDCYGKIK
ncbi:clp protease domain-containing protein [Ditylenchus destructor]|nr:clp protease domain-containing protein [Ditylenchus destructor]